MLIVHIMGGDGQYIMDLMLYIVLETQNIVRCMDGASRSSKTIDERRSMSLAWLARIHRNLSGLRSGWRNDNVGRSQDHHPGSGGSDDRY